jgi:excisionase family DNA binding protein
MDSATEAPFDSVECIEPDDLAVLFKKSKSWVYTMARQGKIPAVRAGGSWLFPRRLIERWLDGASEAEPARPRGRVDALASPRARRARDRAGR